MLLRYGLFFCVFCLIQSITAQRIEEIPRTSKNVVFDPIKKNISKKKQDKSVPCGIDTLYYARYQNSGTSPRYLNLQPVRGGGNFFGIDDTVKLYGFNFFGYALTSQGFLTSQSVTCKVYYANNNGLPSGVPLATATGTINATGFSINQLRNSVMFSSPVTLLSDFVVTIEFPANLSNRIVLASNDYVAGDGRGRNYACIKFSNGNWSNNLVVDTNDFDADFYFEPVVEYNMKVSYDHGPTSCLGNGQPFDFVNTTTFALNPQFSKEAIDSTLDDNFLWDYGDGSSLDTVVHGSHTYSHTLGFYVNLDGTFRNWRGNTCSEDSTIFLGAGDVQANFNYSNIGLVVTFTDKSTNGLKWEWDFGDGSAKSNIRNPNHIYTANGVYYVKQKVWNRGCLDSLTLVVNLEGIGIEEKSLSESIKIGPNPAHDHINIESSVENLNEVRVEIYSIHGKVLLEDKVDQSRRIALNDFDQGVYFIRFTRGEEVSTKRFIVR